MSPTLWIILLAAVGASGWISFSFTIWLMREISVGWREASRLHEERHRIDELVKMNLGNQVQQLGQMNAHLANELMKRNGNGPDDADWWKRGGSR